MPGHRRWLQLALGSYSPKTGLFYRVGWEWCIDLEVVKTEPVLEPMAQLNIGADFKFVAPEGDKLRGHIRARDPVTGKVAFEIPYRDRGAPPHASLLSHRRQRVVRA